MSPGRLLIIGGIVLIVLGVLWTFGEKLPWKPGRLPGDIVIQRPGVSFYFPVVTCVILSVVLSLVMWIFNRR